MRLLAETNGRKSKITELFKTLTNSGLQLGRSQELGTLLELLQNDPSFLRACGVRPLHYHCFSQRVQPSSSSFFLDLFPSGQLPLLFTLLKLF